MSTSASGVVYFHRPARVFPPPLDSEPISMAPPPRVTAPPQGTIFQMFLPMLGSVSLVAFSFVYNNPIFRLIAIGVAVLMLTVGVGTEGLGFRRSWVCRARRGGGGVRRDPGIPARATRAP